MLKTMKKLWPSVYAMIANCMKTVLIVIICQTKMSFKKVKF